MKEDDSENGEVPEEEKLERTSDRAPGSLQADSYEAEDILAGAEPWAPIETKIVLWSFVVALISLVLFGILIHIYILD